MRKKPIGPCFFCGERHEGLCIRAITETSTLDKPTWDRTNDERGSLSNERRLDGDVTSFRVKIDNPWSGDTESGFGRDAYIEIPLEDMIALAKFVLELTK